MEIMVGKTAGFCAGVKNAVEKAFEETKKNKGNITYCLGDLAHNPQVMKRLEENGLKVINELSEIPETNGKKVIFRAHGVIKDIYTQATKMGMEILDLTCPNVLIIHKIAEQYSKEGYHIFLIGEKKHAEVIGTASFCGNHYDVIETQEELENVVQKRKKQIKKLLVISQTTFRLETFSEFVQMIQVEFSNDTEIVVKNTICQATRLRQEETEKMAKEVEYMIIIGGRKSSNTNKLYDIATKNCVNSMMIEDEEELTKDLIEQIQKNEKVGIMAGASTPQSDIIAVKEKIIKINI